MVTDRNDSAFIRAKNEYNYGGNPSTFFDGGEDVTVGGYPQTSAYTGKIQQSGLRTVAPLDLRIKTVWLGNNQISFTVRIGNNTPANVMPTTPDAPTGPSVGSLDVPLTFTATSTDGDNNEIYYQFDWGDGGRTDWLGPYPSGTSCDASNSFAYPGTYYLKARTKDTWEDITEWSERTPVTVSCCAGDRGNVNGSSDDLLDISDLLYFVDYMFAVPTGPAPSCTVEADVDGSGVLDISDLLYLVDYFFKNPAGPAPTSCF